MKFPMSKIADAEFQRVIGKLANTNCSDPHVSYRLGRLYASVKSELNKLDEIRIKAFKKYALKDSKGKIQFDEDGRKPKFKSKTQEQSCIDMVQKYIDDREVNIKIKPIQFSSLKALAPIDWAALEDTDLIEDLPENP